MISNRSYIICIIVLILVIVGLGGYIGYDKIFSQGNKEVIIDDVSIDLNSFYQIQDTLDRLDSAFNNPNTTYFGYIYNSRKIKASKFDINAALFAAAYRELNPSSAVQYMQEGLIQNRFEKIFGENLKYKAGNVDAGELYKLVYDANTKAYAYTSPIITTSYSNGYIAKNIKTTLEEDAISVTRKIIYVEYVGTSPTTINKAILYNNGKKEKKVGELSLKNGDINLDEVIAKYGSRFGTYVYTFKQRKGDDYSFYSIEKAR